MDKYSVGQRIQIVEAYYKNGRSTDNTQRALNEFLDSEEIPNQQIILKVVRKFEKTGSVVEEKSVNGEEDDDNDEDNDLSDAEALDLSSDEDENVEKHLNGSNKDKIKEEITENMSSDAIKSKSRGKKRKHEDENS